MNPHFRRTPPAPVVLALLALGVLVLISFLGGIIVLSSAPALAHQYPEYANLQIPLTCAALGVLLCIEVALVLIAFLVWVIHNGRILDNLTVRLVDALIVTIAVASAICIVGWVFVPGPPPLGIVIIGAAVAGAASVFILIVSRSLLRQFSSARLDVERVS